MRLCLVMLLMIVLCLGCNPAEEARRKAAENNLKQIELALKNYHATYKSSDLTASHVIATETEYYTTGPQQGRPPDGKFPAGTKVSIIEESGSYVLVNSEDGIEAYIAADAIKQKEGTTMDVSGIVEGGNQFALDLYQQLRSEDGNLFFSPSSISVAVAMTFAGAAGDTEAEMAKTLHFQMPKDQLHDGMRALQAFWKTPDKKKGIKLNLANRLWGHEGYEFLPQFLTVTREKYAAELARLNFAQTEEANQAFYEPGIDAITMPNRFQFDGMAYYETLLHEMCHWAEHRHRRNKCRNRTTISENVGQKDPLCCQRATMPPPYLY